jgi:hypothetical protein
MHTFNTREPEWDQRLKELWAANPELAEMIDINSFAFYVWEGRINRNRLFDIIDGKKKLRLLNCHPTPEYIAQLNERRAKWRGETI